MKSYHLAIVSRWNCCYRYPTDGSTATGVSTAANKFHTLYYHKIGDGQSNDVIAAEFPDFADYMGHADVSDDGRYVILTVSEGCDTKFLLWYYDLGLFIYSQTCFEHYLHSY